MTAHEAKAFGEFIAQNVTSLDYQHDYLNVFGKTVGDWRPSEGSLVFSAFFGGRHPSETRSSKFRRLRRSTYKSQMKKLSATSRPFISKNAWNSFRVNAIKSADPAAKFLWIKRDIFDVAASELRSRSFHGSLYRWSSATPANLENLRLERPAIQALEQHRGFSDAIERQLSLLLPAQHSSIWFEDFCQDPKRALAEVAESLGVETPYLHDVVGRLDFTRKDSVVSSANGELSCELDFLRSEGSTIKKYASLTHPTIGL